MRRRRLNLLTVLLLLLCVAVTAMWVESYRSEIEFWLPFSTRYQVWSHRGEVHVWDEGRKTYPARDYGYFLPLCLAALPLLIQLWLTRRDRDLRTRRRWRGLCSNCGYDLRGNESGVCPECGFTFNTVRGRL